MKAICPEAMNSWSLSFLCQHGIEQGKGGDICGEDWIWKNRGTILWLIYTPVSAAS